MCGRVLIAETKEIVEELDLKYEGEHKPAQVNVPPSIQIPLFTDSKSDELQYFSWSLVPNWSKENKALYSTANATIENLKTAPTWRGLVGKRHCVVITKGFYEWQYDDPIKKKGSHPHIIKGRNQKLTLMAGLWDAWKDPATGIYYPSCTIITVPANKLMGKIHNTKGRMPAFLTKETAKIWTDKQLALFEREKALEPVPDDFLIAQEITDVKDETQAKAFLDIC